MQPYQEASQRLLEEEERPGRALKTLGKAAAGLAGGSAVLNRVAPFLNKMIPGDMAEKGLSKIDPRFSKFIKGAVSQGHSMDEVRDFIQDKISPDEKKQQQPEQNQNILAQYSGELHQFVEDHINKGRAPLEAGALAQLDPKFKKAISQMEKDHKTPFSGILQALYGQGQENNQRQQQTQQQEAPQGMQQQSQGQGLEKLMALLQQRNKR